jgi:hypothetical protein
MAGKAISPAITNAPKIVAAAGGGAAAGTYQGALEPNATPESALMQGLESGKDMALAETTGAFVGPLLNKILRPGASSMTPESTEILKLARENGLPISPSVVAPSGAAKAIQGALDNFTPSKMVSDSYRKKAVVSFNKIASELPEVEGVGKVLGNPEINSKVMSTLDEVLGGTTKGIMGAAKEGRETFLSTVGKEGKESVVDISNTLKTLKNVKTNAVDENLRLLVETKLTELKKGKVTAESLDTLMSQVGGAKIKNRADNKFLSEIKEAVKKDFQVAGADMSMLTESGQGFTEAFAALSGKAAKQLKASIAKGDNPASLTEKLYRNESSALLQSLKKRLSKDISESLDAQNLTNMIQNSTKDGPIYGMRVVDGSKLESILKSNEAVLKKNYSPKAITAMENLAKLAKSGAQDTSKLSGKLSRGELATLTLGAGGSYYANDPTVMIGGGLTAAVLARSIMRPKGYMNRWLTTGASQGKSEFAQQAAKLGIRELYDGD